MSLNKATLKSALKTAMEANITGITTTQANQIDTLCGAFADAIDSYVKDATINYISGLLDHTGGVVTGVFGGNLS